MSVGAGRRLLGAISAAELRQAQHDLDNFLVDHLVRAKETHIFCAVLNLNLSYLGTQNDHFTKTGSGHAYSRESSNK
jgi:hypothetical protein